MVERDRAKGLLAQSLYEELSGEDRGELDGALAESPELRADSVELKEFIDALPKDEAMFEGDLVSSVRSRLEESQVVAFVPRRVHYMLAAAAFLLVAGGVVYMIAFQAPVAVAPGVAEAPEAGPFDSVMAEARGFIEGRDFGTAYTVLSAAVEEGEGNAGEAVQLMADLAFDELRRYPDAYGDYDLLRREYSAVFASADRNVLRLNLLDEARDGDGGYPSLNALDAARRGGEFDDLEGVMTRYPATYVASLAAEEMAALARGGVDSGADPSLQLAALASAMARCTSPVARAQLKVEIGHVHERDLNDPAAARALYEEVAGSSITVLARLAKESLSRMDR